MADTCPEFDGMIRAVRYQGTSTTIGGFVIEQRVNGHWCDVPTVELESLPADEQERIKAAISRGSDVLSNI